MQPVWAYDSGICSTIIPQLVLNESMKEEPTKLKWLKNVENIPKGIKAGVMQYFRVAIDIEDFDRDGLQAGVLVTLHHHLDIPINLVNGVILNAGSFNDIVYSPTLHKTTESAIARYPPKDCQCMEADVDFQFLKRPYRKSLNNCLYEAFLQQVVHNCKCTPVYISPVPGYKTCQGVQLQCVSDTKDGLTAGQYQKVCKHFSAYIEQLNWKRKFSYYVSDQ